MKLLDHLKEAVPQSQFNKMIVWLKKLVPRPWLILILARLRYDALIWFCTQGEEKQIYGMMAFQKHPIKHVIGMFDVYITPERRNKDLASHFAGIADMIYQLSQRFKKNSYEYIQCGRNDTTRKLLKLYTKAVHKKYPDIHVEIEQSRIYL